MQILIISDAIARCWQREGGEQTSTITSLCSMTMEQRSTRASCSSDEPVYMIIASCGSRYNPGHHTLFDLYYIITSSIIEGRRWILSYICANVTKYKWSFRPFFLVCLWICETVFFKIFFYILNWCSWKFLYNNVLVTFLLNRMEENMIIIQLLGEIRVDKLLN